MSKLSLTIHAVRAAAVLAILLPATTAGAQDTTAAAPAVAPAARAWELRVTSGSLTATGSQRDRIKDAPVTALQVSWLPNARLAVTSTLAWARSRDLTAADTPKLDVFTADLGVEARTLERPTIAGASVSTFIAAGAGARGYDSRKAATAATYNATGYVGVGGEIGIRRVAVRIEARDYLAGFNALNAAAAAQNDVVVMFALRFNRRPTVSR